MYIQYGCGTSAPKEWVNFDASPTLKCERLPVIGRVYTRNSQRFPPNVRSGDILRGLPVPDGACKGVYASHVLEHLSLHDFHLAIDNTKRIMREGGVFRLLVPDLEQMAAEYIRRLKEQDVAANTFFLENSHLGERIRKRGLAALASFYLGNSKHLWMWDSLSLSHALEEHGFCQVRKCAFGDSSDPMFDLVEDKGRFDGAVAIEARR